MKLYELRKGTRFTVVDDPDKTEITFDHIDGMYSVCYLPDQSVVHVAAFTEVQKLENGQPVSNL